MNRIYNLIWSRTKERWIVVSENVKGNGKVPSSPLKSIAVLAAMFASAGPAYAIEPGAIPGGGQITSGSGSIVTSGSQVTINQLTPQMIVNWQSFNIGESAGVQFKQPGVTARVLNRITDQNPSEIMGSLSANGKVFLVNQSGIIFGKTATVNVGGLVASSLDMLDSDFLAAKYRFTNAERAGAILNLGSIKVEDGGVAVLVAPKVTNEGSITANSGSVLVAAGNQISLDFSGDGLINYVVDRGAVDALVENKGLIKANGGVVVMTAKAADDLRMATVNNSGVIEAQTIQNKAGRILLISDMENGQVIVSGKLDASAPAGSGGSIVVTGNQVAIKDGAHLTASGATGGGEVLVGGSWQNSDPAVPQAISTRVEQGALLEANAADNGNGGTVVAWSDLTNPNSVTRAYGTFEAKGGPNGGDGGRIETSSANVEIGNSALFATQSSLGRVGVWLLDPYDYAIGATQATTISNALKSTDVTVSTSSNTTAYGSNINNSSSGNITLNSAFTSYSPYTLTLNAASQVTISAPISMAGALSISAPGGISLGANITTGGAQTYTGPLTLTADVTLNSTGYQVAGQTFSAAAGVQNVKVDAGSVTLQLVGGTGGQGGYDSEAGQAGGASGDYTATVSVAAGTSVTLQAGSGGGAGASSVANTGGGAGGTGYTGFGGGSGGNAGTSGTSGGGGGGGAASVAIIGASGYLVAGGGGGGAGGDNIRNDGETPGQPYSASFVQSSSTTGGAGTTGYSIVADGGGSGGGGGGLLGGLGGTGVRGGIGGLGDQSSGTETTGRGGYAGQSGASGITPTSVTSTTHAAPTPSSNPAVAGSDGYIKLTGTLISSTGPGGISFSSSVNGAHSLTVNAGSPGVTFCGSVGGSTSLTSLSVGANGTTTLGSNITTTGAQSYGGNVSLESADPTLTSTAGGVTIAGNVSASSTSLTINSGSGAATINGRTSDLSDLTINSSASNSIISGVISGSTNLSKLGSGILILSAANTYTGSTIVSVGTLQVGAGGTTGTLGTGAVTDNASLTFSRSDSVGLSSLVANSAGITGTGSVTATIGGTLTVDKPINVGGPISLYGGNLAINAALTATGSNTITLKGSGTVTDSANGYLVADKLSLLGGDITLDNTSNNVATLAASGVGNLTYLNSDALVLGTVGSVNGINATGTISVATVTGNMTLSQVVTTANSSASAVILNSARDTSAKTSTGGDIIISGGGISVGSGGLARLYTGSISGSTGLTKLLGSGNGRFRYASDESATNYSENLSAGTYAIYREQPLLTVTPSSQSITYGEAVPSFSTSYSGYANGDTSPGTVSGAVTWSIGGTTSGGGCYNAGSHEVTYVGGLASSLGYGFKDNGSSLKELVIGSATLTATVSAPDKVYDGSLTATPTMTITTGLVGTETLGTSATATFNTKDVSTANLVTVTSVSLSDGTGLASNYSLAAGETVSAYITKKALTATVSAPDKVYDGGLTATPTMTITAGLIGTEKLGSSATASFNTKDVSTANLVTVSAVSLIDNALSGGLASNYSLAAGETVSAYITKKALTATVSAPDKVYDGGLTATPTMSITTGLVGTETLGTSATATFNTKDVSTANLVTVTSVSLSDGTGLASNYSLASGETVSAYITKKALTATVSAPDKVYDGGLTATPTMSITTGLVGTETLGTSATATFNTKDVSTANLVTVTSVSLSDGTGLASNYSLAAGETVSAYITKKALTATVSAPDKVYDGGLTATPTMTITAGLIGTEKLGSSATASFNTKDVSTANLVTVSAVSLIDNALSGGLAGNYSLASGETVSAYITKKALSISGITAESKVYDGTALATVNTDGVIKSGLVAGDELSVSATGLFDDKNAANGKSVNLTSSYSGEDVSNYSISSQMNTVASITPASLAVAAINDSKIYNGVAYSGGNGVTYAGFVHGETSDVLGGILAYNSTSQSALNVGSYAITPGGYTSGNYNIAYINGTLTITPKTVMLSASKTYDSTTDLSGAVTIVTGVGSETLTYTDAVASDANVATAGKKINAIALADGSGLASNYQLPTLSSESAPVTIKPKTVMLSASKTYDSTTDLSGAVTIVTGVGSETLTYRDAVASDANVATAGKKISSIALADGTGSASNYQLPALSSESAPVTITPKTVVLSASKTYDSTTDLTGDVTIVTGVGNETLTYRNAQSSDANVATSEKKISEITLADGSNGGLASNYQLPPLSGNSAPVTINPAPLQITATNKSGLDGSAKSEGSSSGSGTAESTGSSATASTATGSGEGGSSAAAGTAESSSTATTATTASPATGSGESSSSSGSASSGSSTAKAADGSSSGTTAKSAATAKSGAGAEKGAQRDAGSMRPNFPGAMSGSMPGAIGSAMPGAAFSFGLPEQGGSALSAQKAASSNEVTLSDGGARPARQRNASAARKSNGGEAPTDPLGFGTFGSLGFLALYSFSMYNGKS